MDYNNLHSIFWKKFHQEPRFFRSPGRINIIGEHVDYNDGLVLPAGIDKEVCMAMAPNDTDVFHIESLDQQETVTFSLSDYREVKSGWAQYIIGVIDQLKQKGEKIAGVNCVFKGDIPLGAGLSSSAALECATLFGFISLFDLNIDRYELAKMAQSAENDYVGVNCGIMDQFASVFSKKGHVLKLDCRDLSFETYQLEVPGYQFVLVDSMVKHNLFASEYNVRRSECEQGLEILKKYYPHVTSLRDVKMRELLHCQSLLDENVFKRCKYIIQEISRVEDACMAMTLKKPKLLGELLYASHEGLRHEYEVSCRETDFLIDFTKNKPEILGARMMGGGFGGCTINLVDQTKMESYSSSVKEVYLKAFGQTPSIYKVKTDNGTSEVIIKAPVHE